MAEAEYKRLGCAAQGCNNTHKAKGLCVNHYRRLQRHGSHEQATGACAHCGSAFIKSRRSAIYCSRSCKTAAWVAQHPARWAELNERKVSAIYAGYCEGCGKAFVSKKKRVYCQRSCRPVCDRPPHVLGRYYTPHIRTCKCCGLQWSAIRRTGPTAYCPSTECQEARLKEKRASKLRGTKSHVQRAKKHGRRYSYFNVLRVFSRDKWTCQVCGVKTPKSLRGKFAPTAPELGHIVALADGGDHVIENCQCECRACNAAKGTKAQGQMWLIGFADTKG